MLLLVLKVPPCNNFVKANVTFNIFTITVVINSLTLIHYNMVRSKTKI